VTKLGFVRVKDYVFQTVEENRHNHNHNYTIIIILFTILHLYSCYKIQNDLLWKSILMVHLHISTALQFRTSEERQFINKRKHIYCCGFRNIEAGEVKRTAVGITKDWIQIHDLN